MRLLRMQDLISFLSGLDLSCEWVTFNPFDKRGFAWDVAADVTSPASALQTATILIPEEQGNNRFFADAARDLLNGVFLSNIESTTGRTPPVV